MKRALLVVLGLWVPAAVVGCQSSEADLCDAECDCRGCSDRDYTECLDGYDRDARSAESLGCPDLYDDLVACREETYVCRGTDFDTNCGVERDRLKNCID